MSDNGISEVRTIISEESITQAGKWAVHIAEVKRNDWPVHFLLESFLVSTRSMDAQTQCGCVLVRDNRIIGSGYNSFIGGIHDQSMPNLRHNEGESEFDGKYPFMIHAEHNAILNCASAGISTKDAIAYATGQPCYNCLQFLYQSGVRNIYYGNNKAVMSQNNMSQTIFNMLYYAMKTNSNMKLFQIEITDEIQEKINKIKSCR